jgi:2'-5' RNA ligase
MQLNLFGYEKDDNLIDSNRYEYFPLIQPPFSINNHTLNLKVDNGVSYREARKSPAHISLMKVRTVEACDDKIINLITWACRGIFSFQVKTNRYNYFNNGGKKTIYMAIENQEPIKHIFERIDMQLSNSIRNRRNFTPHITVFKTIPVSMFEQVYPQMQNKPFEYNFICCSVLILKKDLNKEHSRFKELAKVELLSNN